MMSATLGTSQVESVAIIDNIHKGWTTRDIDQSEAEFVATDQSHGASSCALAVTRDANY